MEPVVKLKRIKYVIKCPGCPQVFSVEEDCVEHLINTCLQFQPSDDHDPRYSFIMWIINYFKNYAFTEENPPEAVKINALLKERNACTAASLVVNIPELSEIIRCPVCKIFFSDAAACAEHLFQDCVRSENYNSSNVHDFLFEYFSTKTEENLAILEKSLANSTPKMFCKYCKTQAPDKESLMNHFPCPQRREENVNEAVCVVCNFSATNEDRLVNHVLTKHIRCEACRAWPKTSNADFLGLKHHLKLCVTNVSKSVRCPICRIFMRFDLEIEFRHHILNCSKELVCQAFETDIFYSKCDICLCQVLCSDIDAHLRKHLKDGNRPSSRQKRLRFSLDDLKNLEVERSCLCKSIFS